MMTDATPDVAAAADQPPVIDAPPPNGNGAHYQDYIPPPPAPPPAAPTPVASPRAATMSVPVTKEQLARVFGPAAPVDPNALGRGARRNPVQQKADADYIDDLCNEPAAINWFMRVDRFMPTIDAARNSLPCDDLMRVKVQPAQFLRENIIQEWGGGDYRITILDENGDPVPGKRSLTMSINTRQYAPKAERYGGAEAPPVVAPTEDDMEILELQRRNRVDAELERSENMQLKIRESALRRKEKEAAIRATEKRIAEAEGGNSTSSAQIDTLKLQMQMQQQQFDNQLALLKTQNEADQKRRDDEAKHREETRLADEKRREDLRIAEEKRRDEQRKEDLARVEQTNRLFADSIKSVGEAVKVIAERPAPTPPPPPDTAGLIVALATALRPQEKPEKPDRSVDVAIEAMKQQTAIIQQNAASENKMMEKWLAVVNKPAPGFGLTDLLAMMDRGERSVTRAIEMVQGSHAGEEEAQAAGGNWWQNMLQSAVTAAMNNPAIANWLIKNFGTQNPTPQQIAQAANAWQQQPPMAMPPPVTPQQLPQGQPMGMPPPVQQVRPAWQHVVNPAQPVQAVDPQQQVPEGVKTPEEHLRDVVTDSMELCANTFSAKSQSSQWVSDADANWPAEFKLHLLMLPSDQDRVNHISAWCDQQVINRLGTILGSDGAVLVRFYDQLHAFLKMQEHLRPKPAVPPAQPAPAAPPVINQAGQVQPVAQPAPVATPAQQAVVNEVAAASV